jgi:hypothetical protein
MTIRMLRFSDRKNRDWHIYRVRCSEDGAAIGIDVQAGSRRVRWMWRLCP